jgi:poly-gamma-glutamate biosynthesis protein PgsC/CapC
VVETFFIGLLVSLVVVEIFGVWPGGIIVPAYLALSLDRPARAALTLAAALLVLAAYKGLSRCFILFGKRRFVIMLLLGGLLIQAGFLIAPRVFASPLEMRILGWVVPGLMASNFQRQRFFPTLAALVAATILTFFLGRLAGLLR